MLKINTTLLLILFALSMSSCSPKKTDNPISKTEAEKASPMKVLVGTYTSVSSEGIYTIDFNPIDGSLSNKTLVAKFDNPSFLTQSRDGMYVYAVNENDPGTLSAFKWNDDKTALILISEKSSEGIHPCFVALNENENMLAVANYSSGNFTVYQVEKGALKSPQIKNHEGSSIVTPNQDSPHAHCSKFSKDGKNLYVADLGIDKIVGYAIDENNQLGEKFTALEMDAGDGPRHFVYHPTKDIVYIVSEFSNTVTVAEINSETGVFSKIDKQSTLPNKFEGDSFCADIHISSDGNFLYASNRGHNSIAIFSVADTGRIKLLGTEAVSGDWPRNFSFSPDENFLLVANQKSNNITVFKRDAKTGLLAFTGVDFKISKPVCLKF